MKLTCLFLTIFLGISAAAQAGGTPFWGAKAPVAYETPTQLLKNGEFTWAPQVAPEGPILVVVSLDEQRAYAYRNGVQIGASTISSGKKGHRTPTGVFHTFLKDADHHSSLCMAIYKSRRDRQFAWFATTGSLSNRVYRKTCSGCYTSCSP